VFATPYAIFGLVALFSYLDGRTTTIGLEKNVPCVETSVKVLMNFEYEVLSWSYLDRHGLDNYLSVDGPISRLDG